MLTALTLVHVILSLIGIVTGLAVVISKRYQRLTSIFLWTTIATSVTGYFFPVHKLLPSHILGALSLIDLAIALRARGRWPKTFAISSTIALYFNVFVLVVQSFEKIPALHDLAPTQSEPPFQIAQGIVLLIFVILGIQAARRAKPA